MKTFLTLCKKWNNHLEKAKMILNDLNNMEFQKAVVKQFK